MIPVSIVSKLKAAIGRWRDADPYRYECTVCDRTFDSERSTCPDCGGDVERVGGTLESTGVDVHP